MGHWTRSISLAVLLLPGSLAFAGPLEPTTGSFVVDADAAAGVLTEADPCVLPGDEAAPAVPVAAEPTLATSAAAAAAATEGQAPVRRPLAFEYSDGYQTRNKIHKYASYATLPLFIAQTIVGQQLYNGNGSRTAHNALTAGTGVLFGVNTVTGVWNLAEGRKDPNRKTKRMVHGLLMLVADAGFVATGVLAPHHEYDFGQSNGVSRSTHRAIALSSMGVATISYLIMLIH